MAADRLWAYALKGNLPQSTRLYNLQVEDVENPVAHQLEIYFCRLSASLAYPTLIITPSKETDRYKTGLLGTIVGARSATHAPSLPSPTQRQSGSPR